MKSPSDLIARLKHICQIKTGRLIDAEGNQHWYFHWKPHRAEAEGPAFISASGTKKWYRYGELHREGGAAIEWADGGREFYRNGNRHRDDGPAIERVHGESEYWKDGKVWPEGKPAAAVIAAEKKEQELKQIEQDATTVADNNIKLLKTVKFNKPPPTLK